MPMHGCCRGVRLHDAVDRAARGDAHWPHRRTTRAHRRGGPTAIHGICAIFKAIPRKNVTRQKRVARVRHARLGNPFTTRGELTQRDGYGRANHLHGRLRMSVSEPAFVDSSESGTSSHGDGMSGPSVVWLANTPPARIEKTLEHFGWPGRSNARALHDGARRWLAEYHPELLEDDDDDDDDDDDHDDDGNMRVNCHQAARGGPSQWLRAALAPHVVWLRRTSQLVQSRVRRSVATSKPCDSVFAVP